MEGQFDLRNKMRLSVENEVPIFTQHPKNTLNQSAYTRGPVALTLIHNGTVVFTGAYMGPP